MGSIGGMLGLSGGAGGTGAQGAQLANITNPTNAAQLGTAYTGAQNSLQSQQGLLQALQGQNGLSNQNQVYGQLQGIASGAVNPAQAQFNQNTGQNVANQAALMAGQRGAGANVGLLARQAAQAGAGIQQNAVGQEASQQATNQINAIGQAGNTANTQASNLVGQTNANAQAQQSEQQALLGAQQGYNSANVSNQSSINAANSSLASGTQGMMGSAIGGGASGVASALMLAGGGQIKQMADGGDASAFSGAQSRFGQFLNSSQNQATAPMTPIAAPNTSGDKTMESGISSLGTAIGKNYQQNQVGNAFMNAPSGSQAEDAALDKMFAKGGKVPALVSPGETYLPPSKVKEVVKDGKNPLREGKKVPGKPKHPGNDYRNDTVPATLEEGGIVIPNKIMQSADPAHESYKFVQNIVAKRKVKG